MDTDERLREEIDTWRERLDEALEEASAAANEGERFLQNIHAYRADADHFEDEGDLVRAFEAIVWAWAWLEIGAAVDVLDWSYPDAGWGPPGGGSPSG